jgi:hypothetical protein
MDFGAARDFDESERRQSSPVEVVLGIREELAEFRRNGGKQALLAKLRASREKDLLTTLRGPDPFEPALSGPGSVIEYLEQRGLIRIERPRNRRRRDAESY